MKQRPMLFMALLKASRCGIAVHKADQLPYLHSTLVVRVRLKPEPKRLTVPATIRRKIAIEATYDGLANEIRMRRQRGQSAGQFDTLTACTHGASEGPADRYAKYMVRQPNALVYEKPAAPRLPDGLHAPGIYIA